jgi:hypothetical protein
MGPTDARPLIGDRYHVLEELGRGGMGVVYRAREIGSEREVALKQLLVRHNGTQSRQAVSLFEREYYILAQLAHPRVIAVYDYGLDTAGPFYTMELLDGGDLRALSPLPIERACALLLEVCSSLALLHARRFVHRDITPRNIRCTRDGHAKLIDFGAMVPMGTCTHVVGTPAFMAPEVLNHAQLDARTDLFSLGATLYYTLTGRSPFGAAQLSNLRELWGEQLVPPSTWMPSIPPALDALCASLLRIDPAQRPGTVFEVMQRLQAITGISLEEAKEVQQAYLTTPALIGRDDGLRCFRQGMRRALHGAGSALMFEGAPGLGRSRVLEACVLEAKTLGATVLRAAASTAAGTPFAVAQSLLEQLLQSLPEAARAAVAATEASSALVREHAGLAKLCALGEASLERSHVQQGIADWITRVCQSHAVLLAVDDVERADEATIALLAALALEAKDLRLAIAVTTDLGPVEQLPHAFDILREHALRHPLRALSHEQIEALLVSVFGNVPHLSLLAERLFQVALGNPRDTMQLAQHLVNTRAIEYQKGQWTLPAELQPEHLPASAAEALATRIAALPPLARQLAEAQALAGTVLRREDYVLLASGASAAALEAAITTLIAQEIVQSDGEYYRLSHRGLADALRALLGPAQQRERHLALYELHRRRPDVHPYFIFHHLLEAQEHERALDLLASPEGFDERAEREASERVDAVRLASALEHALGLAIQLRRPPREQYDLRRGIFRLILRAADHDLHARVTPAWLEQLVLDSGLADYRALDPTLPASARLQQALAAAAARFAATPAGMRVYRVDEAIKGLAFYVIMSIVKASQSGDPRLAASLAALLEPFAPISLALHAVWQNAMALHEMVSGRVLRARARWMEVYVLLEGSDTETMPWLVDVRHAIAQGIAKNEAAIGRKSAAFEWAARLDGNPIARVGAMYERRLACLMQGDAEGADHFGRQAELLSLRNSPRQMIQPSWWIELEARSAIRDLAGMRNVIDAMRSLAARHTGWRPPLREAEGQFDLLRGDLNAARHGFEQAIALACPDGADDPIWVGSWSGATAGLMAVHLEWGNPTEACALGERALAICHAHGFELNVIPITQQLALAEAKLGRFESAGARMDALLEYQTQIGMQGMPMAQSYVTRARIAIWAQDAGAAARFAALASGEPGGDKVLATVVHNEPLIAEARRAGVELALAPSAFEISVFGNSTATPESPLANQLREALRRCADAEARAARTLELLSELALGENAQLYLAGRDERLMLVATSPGAKPDARAMQFAQGFFAQQLDDEGFTAGLTHATQMLSLPGAAAYVDERGREARLFMLTCKERGTLVYVGLAVMQVKSKARLDAQLAGHITVLAACLLSSGDTPGIRTTDFRGVEAQDSGSRHPPEKRSNSRVTSDG